MTPRRMRAAAVALLAGMFATLLAASACAPTAPTNAPPTSTAPQTSTAPPSSATTSEGTSETTGSTEATGAGKIALGKVIFDTGRDASGTIKFTDGTTAVKTAGIAPCVNCHGPKGTGMTGLGPAITWTAIKDTLKTQQLFDQAVTQGKDEEGKPLATKMPRFQMSTKDLTALYAYIKTLQ